MTRTDAYRNFEANLDELLAMLKLARPRDLHRVMRNVGKRIHRQLQKNTAANAKAISSALSDLTSAVDEYITGRTMLQDWIAIVLVTLVHAYLEDGLVFIATKDRRLLKTADALDRDRVFEVTSIEELRAELRKQWANKTLLGGPEKWLPRLHEMGARGYKKDCGFRLQHLWDTRNLIVHRRGIATTAYLRKQGNPSVKPGDRVRVSLGLLTWWLQGVHDFVDSMDQFFLRYRAKTSRA
jgi:hypothetical protein